MRNLSRQSRGSALLVSIFITGTLIIVMIGLLDHIIPLSRNVRGIENSTIAYYEASAQIEKALATLNLRNPGHSISGPKNANTLPTSMTTATGGCNISELTNAIPLPWTGNSEYDKNWNQIGPWAPVQLFIPKNYGATFLNEFQLDLRVPKVQSKTATNTDILTPLDSPATRFFTNSTLYPVVFWVISDGKTTLMPNMSSVGTTGLTAVYDASSINRLNTDPTPQLKNMIARDNVLGNTGSLDSLYSSELGNCVASGCTLKLTVANVLKSETGQVLPYLEYRVRRVANNIGGLSAIQFFGYGVDTITNQNLELNTLIPSQYTSVSAEGYRSGFKRTRIKKIQQLTTSEALDFTVFQ